MGNKLFLSDIWFSGFVITLFVWACVCVLRPASLAFVLRQWRLLNETGDVKPLTEQLEMSGIYGKTSP